MGNDAPMAIILLLMLGAAVWIIRQSKGNKAPAPGAPDGQEYIPLAPSCVANDRRWLLLPSQEI